MKKLILLLIAIFITLPNIGYASFAVPLQATSTNSAGQIFPQKVNGNYLGSLFPYYIATSTTATSTFNGDVLFGGAIKSTGTYLPLLSKLTSDRTNNDATKDNNIIDITAPGLIQLLGGNGNFVSNSETILSLYDQASNAGLSQTSGPAPYFGLTAGIDDSEGFMELLTTGDGNALFALSALSTPDVLFTAAGSGANGKTVNISVDSQRNIHCVGSCRYGSGINLTAESNNNAGAGGDVYINPGRGDTGQRNGNVIMASSTGNVGIGTTSPAYPLSVEGISSLGNQARAGFFTATSTTATSTFINAVGIGSSIPSTWSNLTYTNCNGSYPLSVTSGGCSHIDSPVTNLGPAFEVDVSAGASAGGRGIVFNQTNTADVQDFILASSSAANTSAFNLKGAPTGKGVMKIEHTGNGTGYSSGSALSIDLLIASDAQGIFLKGATGGTGKLLNILTQGSASLFNVLDTSGFTGIKTSAPTYNLDVTGNGHFTSLVDADHFVATSSSISSFFLGGAYISTSTGAYPLTVYSATGNQFSISAGAGIAQWTMSNEGGTFFLSTTTVAGTATSSPAAVQVNPTGPTALSVGTTTSTGILNLTGVGAGSSTKGVCFQIKAVGTAAYVYSWYDSSAAQHVQTTTCGGTGTTTVIIE